MLSYLIAVSEYVKLCMCYKSYKVCKQPYLKASIVIAYLIGKGPYFAFQICHNEMYLMKHHCLSPHKEYMQHGQHLLLDNEAVLHNMHVYLAAQFLGTVTPWEFCYHVNHIILPALGVQGVITNQTAQQWLRLRLGY